MEVRRAGDEGHPAGFDDAQPDHRDEGIGTALGDRQAGRQAEMGCRIVRQAADRRPIGSTACGHFAARASKSRDASSERGQPPARAR